VFGFLARLKPGQPLPAPTKLISDCLYCLSLASLKMCLVAWFILTSHLFSELVKLPLIHVSVWKQGAGRPAGVQNYRFEFDKVACGWAGGLP
jgi:hypothetical protein